MPFITSPTEGSDHQANLRRLIASRWVVLTLLALLVSIAPGSLDIPLAQWPLFGIIGIAALLNGIAWLRIDSAASTTSHELFSQLLLDISALSALIFFTGGATNPLVSLLLPPVAIAALTLPTRGVLAIGASAIGAYSLLMRYYVPLPMPDATRATHLHLIGMWLTFVVSAVLIAWFVVRMTRLIRQRDAELAASREQALRAERVMAMGTLAAGAAHELGTPLATMALLAGELNADTTLPEAVRQDIALLRQQIGICKEIITGLSRRAGAERLETAPLETADRWLDKVRQHWHASRPQAASHLIISSVPPAPLIVADPRLEQALLNLLNNAASASPQPLEINLDWNSHSLSIAIRDHGPGFPPSVLAQGGQHSFPAHDGGSGVGLMLTRTAIEQLGGHLNLSNSIDGGALARLELPQAAA